MKKTIATIALALLMCCSAFAQTAWDYETKTDIEGKTTEYATSGSFVIRCSQSCKVFFTPERYTLVEDGYNVLVKFNDKPAKQYSVTRSEDYTAYFFDNPIAILRAIRDNGGYITIQYKPYEKIAETVKYGVWNLPPTILVRIAETKAKKDALKDATSAFVTHTKICAELSEKTKDVYSSGWSAAYEKSKKEGRQ